MKKFLALLLALVMVFALAACGSEDTTPSENPTEPSSEPTTDVSTAPDDGEAAADPDDISDTMEADTYEVAFVTDVGQLKDKSFNEGTWNGVKTYAYENGLSYKYYQPANGDEATDDDRYDAMAAAVNGVSRATPS